MWSTELKNIFAPFVATTSFDKGAELPPKHADNDSTAVVDPQIVPQSGADPEEVTGVPSPPLNFSYSSKNCIGCTFSLNKL